MHAQWGNYAKSMRSHDILSFFSPTLGRVNVQNSDFINLTSRTKRFHPTPVPAWIPQFLTVVLQLQLHAARTDLCAPLGEGGKSSQGWKDKSLSFKLKNALPRALFRFPSVSFADASALKQSGGFFLFIFFIIFVRIPTLPLQPTLRSDTSASSVVFFTFVDCS